LAHPHAVREVSGDRTADLAADRDPQPRRAGAPQLLTDTGKVDRKREADVNGSLYTADRTTHRRIVLTAGIAAALVILIGLGARAPLSNGLAAAPQPTTKLAPVVVPSAITSACDVARQLGGCRVA